MTLARFPIHPDALFGCNRLGHAWDDNGDCRHCDANQDDNPQDGA
jgi:hypothetical protein